MNSTKTVTDIRGIAGNTLMLYFRMFMVMGVSLYTSRIVLEQLGTVDYGIYSAVGSIVVLLTFLDGAMSLSTVRFLSFALGRNDTAGASRIFRTAFSIHIILSLIILLLAETLGLWFLNHYMKIPPSQLSAANWVYQCTLASFIFSILRSPVSSVVIAHEKMKIFAVLSVLEVVMKLMVALSLTLILADKLKAYAILNLGAVIVFTAINVIYCSRYFPECRSFRPIYDKEMFRPMTRFMSWSIFGHLSWIGKNQGCNILLNLFFGPVVNAAYALAAQVNAALNGFVQNFTTAINPRITKTYSSGEFGQSERLIIYGSKISFYLLLILSFPILIATKPILRIWLATPPPDTAVFIQLVIINSLIESFTYCLGAGIRATGEVKLYEIIVGSIHFAILPLAYVALYYGLNPQSIFIIMIILSCVALCARLAILKKYLKSFSILKMCRIVFLPAGVITAILTGLFVLYKMNNLAEIINPFITIATSALLVIALEFLIGFNSSERKFITKGFASKFAKYKHN